MLNNVITAARGATEDVRMHASLETEGRIVHKLIKDSGFGDVTLKPSTQVVARRITHKQLALKTGKRRETVSRRLKTLEDKGLLTEDECSWTVTRKAIAKYWPDW